MASLAPPLPQNLLCLVSLLPCFPGFGILPVRQRHGQLLRRLVRPSLSNQLHDLLEQHIVACRTKVDAYRPSQRRTNPHSGAPLVPSYMSSARTSFGVASSDPGSKPPSFQASILKLAFSMNAFQRLITGTSSFTPISTMASAYSFVVAATRVTLGYPLF